MENKLYNINDFLVQILNDEELCEKYSDIVLENELFLRENYTGIIQEELLIKIIKASKQNISYEKFLNAIVICLKKEEISNAVFDQLLAFHGKYRKSILIGLAHCPLSYYQLIEMNKRHFDEALAQLLELQIKFDCFSESDLVNILKVWEKEKVKNTVEFIAEKNCNTKKGRFLKMYLSLSEKK